MGVFLFVECVNSLFEATLRPLKGGGSYHGRYLQLARGVHLQLTNWYAYVAILCVCGCPGAPPYGVSNSGAMDFLAKFCL